MFESTLRKSSSSNPNSRVNSANTSMNEGSSSSSSVGTNQKRSHNQHQTRISSPTRTFQQQNNNNTTNNKKVTSTTTRFASDVAASIMDKFPTEESAKAQLLFAQLQVEALVDMNAKLQKQLREVKEEQQKQKQKQQEKSSSSSSEPFPVASAIQSADTTTTTIVPTSTTTTSALSSSSSSAASQHQVSQEELKLLDVHVERIIHALDPSCREQQQHQEEQTFSSSSSSLSISVITEKLSSIALPLVHMFSETQRKQRRDFEDMKQQVSDSVLRETMVESVVKQREEKLNLELEETKSSLKSSNGKCEELSRQLHYLKQFQIALCSSSTGGGGSNVNSNNTSTLNTPDTSLLHQQQQQQQMSEFPLTGDLLNFLTKPPTTPQPQQTTSSSAGNKKTPQQQQQQTAEDLLSELSPNPDDL